MLLLFHGWNLGNQKTKCFHEDVQNFTEQLLKSTQWKWILFVCLIDHALFLFLSLLSW